MCTVLQSVFDWFWGLNLAQKVLAVLFAALLLFSTSFLVSTAVLRLMGGGGERAGTPSEQSASDGDHHTGSPGSESAGPDIAVNITSARWEGKKAVVEGTWRGDVSAVHCDLLEGGASGIPTRWWDRSVGTQMDWSARTFTQEFVAAEKDEGWEPLDPLSSYGVSCTGRFSSGWATSASAQLEGKPTG